MDMEWKKVGFIMRSKKNTTINFCINEKWYYLRISDFINVIEGKEKYATISEAPKKEAE